MDDYKYIILDFGNVVVTPTTGDWDITPKFIELIDMDRLDKDNFYKVRKKYAYILSEQITTLEQEYDMFSRYYGNILKNCNYPNYNEKIAKIIAFDRTYKHDKYKLCKNIYKELGELFNRYKLLMLTDNWPCVIPYMKDYNLYDYFDKIYVSSVYGEIKKDKLFFDHPIEEYNIKNGEALFIDDAEENLDVATEKGMDVLQMDRYYNPTNSKYEIINNLENIKSKKLVR